MSASTDMLALASSHGVANKPLTRTPVMSLSFRAHLGRGLACVGDFSSSGVDSSRMKAEPSAGELPEELPTGESCLPGELPTGGAPRRILGAGSSLGFLHEKRIKF